MLKPAGAFFLLTASLLLGLRKRYSLYKRLNLLRECESAALTVEARLRCLRLPLDECFSGCGGIFSDAAVIIQQGSPPLEAVKKAASRTEFLKDCDRTIFYEYAEGLSSDDCEGQLSNIKMLSLRLGALIEDASAEVAKYGKLAVEGSILAGAAIVLLMI